MTSLTRQEKHVIVFLIVAAALSISYSYYKKFNPPIDIEFRRTSSAEREEYNRLLREEKSVNINKANIEELIKLRGVGPVLADRIIKYRRAQGLFKDKAELKKIQGIGPKKFNAIKDYILIE